MNNTKPLYLAASLLFALTFIFSCSSDDGDCDCEKLSGNSANSSSSSSSFTQSSSSSSSFAQSSSSSVNWCEGFVNGTPREHYGELKPQFCDERDGKKYVYVTIGEQTWMAENLNYVTYGGKCGDGLYISNANTPTCDTYGRLYEGNVAASRYSDLCPPGWYMPSLTEWETLVEALGGASEAGFKLKTTSGWGINGDIDQNGADEYGFSALPSGYAGPYDDFYEVGYSSYWWSSTAHPHDNYTGYYIEIGSWGTISTASRGKSMLYSVRCLRN